MKSLFKLNIWFFLLLVLIAIDAFVLFRVNQYLNHPVDSHIDIHESEVKSTENQLILHPSIINQYIQKDETDDLHMQLQGNTLAIRQKSKFLGRTIITDITTHPKVIGRNKLKLDIVHVDVADLPLSKKQTLNIISRFGKLPDNVVLDVDKECFYYEMKPIMLNKNALVLNDIDTKGWHFNLDIKEW